MTQPVILRARGAATAPDRAPPPRFLRSPWTCNLQTPGKGARPLSQCLAESHGRAVMLRRKGREEKRVEPTAQNGAGSGGWVVPVASLGGSDTRR